MPTPSTSDNESIDSSTSQALVNRYQIKLANKWGRIGLTLSTLPEEWWQQANVLLASSLPSIHDVLRGLMLGPAQVALAAATAKAPPDARLMVAGFQRDLPKLRRSGDHIIGIDGVERASDDSEGYKSEEHTGSIIHSFEDCYDEEDICRYRALQCQCDHIEITEAAQAGEKRPEALCVQAFEWQPSEMGVQYLMDCEEAAAMNAGLQREPLAIGDTDENDNATEEALSGHETAAEPEQEESEQDIIEKHLQKMQQLCKQELLFTLIKRRHQLMEKQEQQRVSKNCALVYAEPQDKVQEENKTLKECHEAGSLMELYDKADALFNGQQEKEFCKESKLEESLMTETEKVKVQTEAIEVEQENEQKNATASKKELSVGDCVAPKAESAIEAQTIKGASTVQATKMPMCDRSLLEAMAAAHSTTKWQMTQHDMYLESSFPAERGDDSSSDSA